MKKGQGALEYLIIIAAVLAIAAIVVLFLSGAFKSASTGGDVGKCKQAASQCATELATSSGATCSYCDEACSGTGLTTTDTATYPTAVDACKAGKPEVIVSA